MSKPPVLKQLFVAENWSKVKRVSRFIAIILFIVFVASLYIYLQGPVERVIVLENRYEEEIHLASMENRAILLNPLVNEALFEYYHTNLLGLLINRSMSINLKTDYGNVSLYVMNSTQFDYWRNDSDSYNESFYEQIESVQQILPPGDFWASYYVVLLNKNNYPVKVNVKILDKFYVKILDYDYSFVFLKISIMSATSILFLLWPLLTKLEYLMKKVKTKNIWGDTDFTTSKWEYLFIFYAPVILIGVLEILYYLIIYQPLVGRLSFVKQIFIDFIYRVFLFTYLLSVILAAVFTIIYLLLDILNLPLIYVLRDNYENRETFLKYVKAYSKNFDKILVQPSSIALYVFCVFLLYLMHFIPALEPIYPLAFIILILAVYAGHVVSKASLKAMQEANYTVVDLRLKFNLLGGMVGSATIVSICCFSILNGLIPLLTVLASFIIDRSVLVSVSGMPELFLSRPISNLLVYLTPYIAYLIPFALMSAYYSIVISSIFYLYRDFKDTISVKNILKEFIYDHILLFITFIINMYLQSLFTNITLQEILLSLSNSIMITLVNDYLIVVLRK
ncbi:MAG: hypothetical protein QXF92_02050 [Thermosphaera sp.]